MVAVIAGWLLVAEDLNEPGEGTVVGLFHLRWKAAGRQLVEPQVVSDALTALSLPWAGLVGAVTD